MTIVYKPVTFPCRYMYAFLLDTCDYHSNKYKLILERKLAMIVCKPPKKYSENKLTAYSTNDEACLNGV